MSKEMKVAIISFIGVILAALITAIVGPVIVNARNQPNPPPTITASVNPPDTPVPDNTTVPAPTDTPTPVLQSSYGETPVITMHNFCVDLYGGNLQAAYNLLSQRFQDTDSENAFLNDYYQSSCGITYGITPGQGGDYQTQLDINYPNGTIDACTYTLIEENGGWAIDNSVCQRIR